jgi:hypothetical protein
VRVGGGKGVTTVRSGNFFNDGKPHSVSVIKTNRRLTVQHNVQSFSLIKIKSQVGAFH